MALNEPNITDCKEYSDDYAKDHAPIPHFLRVVPMVTSDGECDGDGEGENNECRNHEMELVGQSAECSKAQKCRSHADDIREKSCP